LFRLPKIRKKLTYISNYVLFLFVRNLTSQIWLILREDDPRSVPFTITTIFPQKSLLQSLDLVYSVNTAATGALILNAVTRCDA